MHLTKAFVFSMAVLVALLLAVFATEETRCIERARRLIQEELAPAIPVNVQQVTAFAPLSEASVCVPPRSGRSGLG